MNRQERELIDRLDAVLRELGTLTPQNPADVRAVSGNLRIAVAATKELTQAVNAIRCQDWSAAGEHLTEAERISAR